MPMLTSAANALTKSFPKVLSPKAHAVADYLTIGIFLVTAALFWRRNKRAAMASAVCGAAELATNLLTDYPGGVKGIISFPMHGKIDIGLAAMIATMPEFMAFPREREKTFFLTQAALVTAVTNLTDFDSHQHYSRKRPRRAA